MDSLVPKLLDAIPVLDLATLQEPAQVVRLRLVLSLLADVKVQFRVVEDVLLLDST